MSAMDRLKQSMKDAARPMDWVEDFDHENGCYQCKCDRCGGTFTGHKRRVVCRSCASVKCEGKE